MRPGVAPRILELTGAVSKSRCNRGPGAFILDIVRTLLAAAAAATACNHVPLPLASGPAPAPAPAAAASAPKAFAVPDETMEFRASFRGIPVGLVQTAVGQPGWIGDRHAIVVRSRGKSDGLASLFGDLVWELSTTVDLDASVPIEDREEAWLSFAGHDEHHDNHHTWSAGDAGHDVHSVVSALRGWQSRSGDSASAEVRLAGGHFPVVVWNAGRDLLAALGKPAIRYEGRVHGRFPFTIWISDDAARVPLEFRTETPIGTVAVELVDYQVRTD